MLRADRDARRASATRSRGVAVEEALAARPPAGAASQARSRALAAHGAAPRPRPPRPPRRGRRRRRGGAAPRPGRRRARRPRSAPHREAAAQFARALRYADGLARRAPRGAARAPLVRVLPDQRLRRAPSRRVARALDEHRAAGDRRGEGDSHRWLSRLLWFFGDNAAAEEEARRAVRAARAARRRAASSPWPTATWRSCGCSATISRRDELGRAGHRAGRAPRRDRDRRARAEQRRGRRAARGAARRPGQARAQPRDGARGRSRGARRPRVHQPRRRARRAPRLRDRRPQSRRRDRLLRRARPRRVAGLHDRLAGALASSIRAAGTTPPRSATVVLAPHVSPRRAASRRSPSSGRLRARRGDPDPWSPLDEARELAAGTGELQRLAPVAGARAEARWLAGDDRARSRGRPPRALALALAARRPMGCWRAVPVAPACRPRRRDRRSTRSPSRTGSSSRASARPPRALGGLGCPYEAALARGRRRRRRPPSAAGSPSCSRSARGRPPPASPAPCASAACATCGGARAPPRARTRPA